MKDNQGKVIYIDSKDKLVGSVWNIPNIPPMSRERLQYPTQKPEALIERIIKSVF